MRTCNFEGCDKKHKAKGYCNGHYKQIRRGEKLSELIFYRPNGSDPRITFNKKTVWSKENFYEGTPCLECTGSLNDKGYGLIWANGKDERAHVFAWKKVNGKVPEGYEIHHDCRNRKCVNVEHLQCLTHAEHSRIHNEGEKSHSAKLNNEQVLEIRAKYDTGDYLQRELAEKYGVSIQNISDIVNNKTWRHV